MIKVKNMTGRTGKEIANQFIITNDIGFNFEKTFQSYSTTIARISINMNKGASCEKVIKLDRDKWDYSKTTSKYRNQFLGMTTAEIKAGIKSGTIQLVNLNA